MGHTVPALRLRPPRPRHYSRPLWRTRGAGSRLGLSLGYWGMGNDADNLALAREADRLGYSVAWAAEA